MQTSLKLNLFKLRFFMFDAQITKVFNRFTNFPAETCFHQVFWEILHNFFRVILISENLLLDHLWNILPPIGLTISFIRVLMNVWSACLIHPNITNLSHGGKASHNANSLLAKFEPQSQQRVRARKTAENSFSNVPGNTNAPHSCDCKGFF
jgi:hypothetical protein